MDHTINVNGEKLDIREGRLLDLTYPTPLRFEGHLHAPSAWMENKNALGLLDKSVCHVEVSEDAGTLKFVIDHRNEFKDTITGKLVKSKVIETFGINSESKKYSDKELARLFRQNAFYFKDQDVNKQICLQLSRFSAKVEKNIEKNDDRNGNKKELFEQTVEHSVDKTFIMVCPMFNGYPDVHFEVSILCEATTTGCSFYLESVDLFRLEEEIKRSILHAEIERFEAFGCAIITK